MSIKLTSGQFVMGDHDNTYLFYGTNTVMSFQSSKNDQVFVIGNRNIVTTLGGSSALDVTDLGRGTIFNIKGFGDTLTIRDFQFDTGARVQLAGGYKNGADAAAHLVSDHHGGSTLAIPGGSIHFVSARPTAAQIAVLTS